MKNTLLLLSGCLLLPACAAAQAADCAAQPVQENSEAAIRSLETSWSRAYWTGDTAFLECLYAPGFHSADSKGKLHDREGDISGARSFKGKSWKPRPNAYQTDILMFPHTAVATNFKVDGAHVSRVTDIYEYDGRRWHAIFSQDTRF
ncbi:MAG: nuclear transport factor 2 family protein [Rhodanobacter sp.]